MFKNFIIIEKKNGIDFVSHNIGGTNLTKESLETDYPDTEIIELNTVSGIPTDYRVSCYNDDYSLKSEEQLKSEGLDENGVPLPSAEELEAKAQAEQTEKEAEQRREKEDEARAVFGDDIEDVDEAIFRLAKKRLNNDIILSADRKQKAAYRAVLLHNIPDPERWEISDEQIKRYEVKLAIAQDDSDNSLSEKEKQKVIAAYEASERHLRPLIVLIDACRRVLQKAANKATTEEELGNIRAQMKAAEEFHTQTPKNELDNWAKALGGWREAT